MYRIFVPQWVNLHVSDDAPLGGAIVFSTDVNVVRLHRITLLNLFFQMLRTFWQRVFLIQIISQVVTWQNDKQGEQIRNLTILPQRGIYISPSGKRFKEKSVRLELTGASRMLLTETAKVLLQQFCQQSVMVVCYDEGVKFHVHR